MRDRLSWMGAALVIGVAATGCSSGTTGDDASPGSDSGPQTESGISGQDSAPGTTDGATSDAASSSEAGSDVTSSETGSDATSSDEASTCRPKFASGVNVAWINFANDIPNPDLAKFDTLFTNVAAAGGRAVRWWFHTNGTVTPGYDANGMAAPISASDIADVKSILDHAHAAGVGVNISLWSFDMLQGTNEGISATITTNNTNLLTIDANRQAYIDNVLTPLATALKGYPGLYSWEIFNEPEGMTTQNGWVPTANKIDESVVQKNVNWFAAAIHSADPSAMVTNGAWTFIANSTVSDYNDYYSDTALTAAGGKSNGTLDFYEVHYYDNWNGSDVVSPFTHPSTFWALPDTKRIIIGEFWAIETNAVAAADLYTTLYTGGYSGAWAWQYENADDPGPDASTVWPAMQVPMNNLFTAHTADLTCP